MVEKCGIEWNIVELCSILSDFQKKIEKCRILSQNVGYFQKLQNNVEYCRKMLCSPVLWGTSISLHKKLKDQLNFQDLAGFK